MDLSTWLLFVGTEVVLSLVPGPAVCFVVAQGLRAGVRPAMAASLGILLANAVYFLLSALGLGAVLVAMPNLLNALRWLGIGYLVWLGLHALWPRGTATASSPPAPAATGSPLRLGFWLQMANPKALLFFVSILPGFVALERADAWPAWLQITVFGVTSVAAEIWVLFGYGALAAAASRHLRDGQFARWLDRGAGVVLLAVAAWMLLHS